MAYDSGFIVVLDSGERVGSMVNGPIPAPGDLLLLRHQDDSGPSWEVVRREFVNAQTVLVVVREADEHAPAAHRLTDWT